VSLKRFDDLVSELRHTLAGLSDKRKGSNTTYSMEAIGLSAFSVFFTQSPSFLAHQKTMEKNKGQSNCKRRSKSAACGGLKVRHLNL